MKIKAESIVRSYLIQKGFCVSNNRTSETCNGIDLVALKNGSAYLIEVKAVSKGKRNTTITPVLKSGLKCEYIAIVTPKNNVIFQPMDEHLKLISKNGSRGVSKLVRLYDEM